MKNFTNYRSLFFELISDVILPGGLGASTNTILPNLLSGFKKIKCSRLDITFKVNSVGVQTSFGLRGIQLSPDQVHGTKFSWKSLRPAYPIVVNCGISSASMFFC